MSEHDNQATAPAHEQAHDETRAQVERSDRGSGGGKSDRRRSGRRRHGGQSSQPSGERRRADSSLNMEELRELTELFSAHGLTDFEFENAEIRVRLSRNVAPAPAASAPTPSLTNHLIVPPTAVHAPQPTAAHAATPPSPVAAEEPAEELHIITSPIVGTFYRAPSPNADAFVKPGSHVEHDSVVCIIEAMKLMNEIQAETTGTIEKIYVENGQPVEYGQPLFGVKK